LEFQRKLSHPVDEVHSWTLLLMLIKICRWYSLCFSLSISSVFQIGLTQKVDKSMVLISMGKHWLLSRTVLLVHYDLLMLKNALK
jgi:hypothetical protein